MHPTAMRNCEIFFHTYARCFAGEQRIRVVDIGSQDVNGSLRSACPPDFEYIGVDFQQAKNVDIVLDDPYSLPFENESFDIVLSSSCLEHSEMFWLVFLEIMRVLKPKGVFYLNVPSTGLFHRFPVDCWRFYPGCGNALINWAKRNGIDAALLESYTQIGGYWQDCVSIFLKDKSMISKFPNRTINGRTDIENGQIFESDEIKNPNTYRQNRRKMMDIMGMIGVPHA